MSTPKEVQIIVRGGFVRAIHNWPKGLPGAVYDHDLEPTAAATRCPVEHLIEDGEATPDYVLVNTGAFDWLIAKAMARPKGEN